MTFRLYDTPTRSVQPIRPISEDCLGVYTCGPTVYHHAHLGNLRTYISSDLLVRCLRLFGFSVKHVMNITDVGHLTSDEDEGEDKMIVGAAREGISAWEIADRYTRSFFEQCSALNITTPSIVCRATEHIPEQIELIQRLEAKGFTYSTEDGIYFDTTKFESYADFAKLDVEGLRGGARVELSGCKKCKTDFALWKFSKEAGVRLMEWESPWGLGFPGWHLECSAMSMKYLGEQFDIHTGGIDHIPVHHTNEIAQSEAVTGKVPFVSHWMHCNFLQMKDDEDNQSSSERMSKSSGKFLTVTSLTENDIDPLAYRFLCLRAHYRTGMKFSWEILKSSAATYRRFRESTSSLISVENITEENKKTDTLKRIENEISGHLFNDLATPAALVSLQKALESSHLDKTEKKYLIQKFDDIFALDLLTPVQQPGISKSIPPQIQDLVNARTNARRQRNWLEADRLRDLLLEQGYTIEDSPDGAVIKNTNL